MLRCEICGDTFQRSRKSKRRTCSKSCAVALSWLKEGVTERRSSGIKAALDTPEGRERVKQMNEHRWSDPTEHEKLSRLSRDRWQDPEMRERMSDAIREINQRPEMRKLYSVLKKDYWRARGSQS